MVQSGNQPVIGDSNKLVLCRLCGDIGAAAAAAAPPAMSSDSEPNHGVRPPYPNDETILDQLHRHVRATPDALSLVVPEGDVGHRGRLEMKYEEMWALIEQTAGVVNAARARDRSIWVILVLPQGLQQVIAVWSILRSGCG
eukprot:5685865-Prymnesium_polylepis.2